MVIGVDEAGRGAWAGPLVAAAVALEKPIAGMNDSKALTPKKRGVLYESIIKDTKVGIGQVAPADIDKYGLSWAQRAAMLQALKSLGASEGQIIVDGKIDYLGLPNSRAQIKADSQVEEVMAASIIAKVYRDGLMADMDNDFPGYGFKRHKGYGTKAHAEALRLLGVCQQHRQSYKPVAARL